MNDKHSPGEGRDDGAVAPPDAAYSLRRRRLLKIGAGAAPATLLLVGRPVHAQSTCVSTSAWGSQMVNPAASVTLRTQATARQVTAWTVTEWQNNKTHLPLNHPWQALGSGEPGQFKKITIAGAGIVAPRGTASDSKIYDVLHGSNAFARTMLVALLNEKLLAGRSDGPSSCVRPGTLATLARGDIGLSQNTGGSGWSDSQVIEYLQKNGLAAP